MVNPLLKGLTVSDRHPGAILAEIIVPALKRGQGVTKVALCGHLSLTRPALDNILKGAAPISPETALRLGKLLNSDPEFWMRLQVNYDLARAAEALGDSLDALPVLTAA